MFFFFFWSCSLAAQQHQMSSLSLFVWPQSSHPVRWAFGPRSNFESPTVQCDMWLGARDDGRTHSKYCTSVHWVELAMATQLKAKPHDDIHMMSCMYDTVSNQWIMKSARDKQALFLCFHVQIEAFGFIIKNVQHLVKKTNQTVTKCTGKNLPSFPRLMIFKLKK